ncbi:hypothetical protein FI667_g6848, partial [Globisporangium splendens]
MTPTTQDHQFGSMCTSSWRLCISRQQLTRVCSSARLAGQNYPWKSARDKLGNHPFGKTRSTPSPPHTHTHTRQLIRSMLPAQGVHKASKPRRWLARMLELRVGSLRRLLVAGVALCVIVKATYEMFFVRYVDGKRCERLGSVHLERDFHNPNDCFSSGEVQQIILGLVFAIADVFERNNVTYWLDSGTLLGSYREDAVILYDDDADIGIDEATYIRLRDGDEQLAFPSVYELHLHGAKFRKQGRRDPGIPGRLVHTKSGLYVDMFVFLESKTAETDAEPMFGPLPSKCFRSCVRCPKVENRGKEFKIPKSWVYPLKKCLLGGREPALVESTVCAAASTLKGRLECEQPNSELYELTGHMDLDSDDFTTPPGPEIVMLRGCRLRCCAFVSSFSQTPTPNCIKLRIGAIQTEQTAQDHEPVCMVRDDLFWYLLLVSSIAAILLDFTVLSVQHQFMPTPEDVMRERCSMSASMRISGKAGVVTSLPSPASSTADTMTHTKRLSGNDNALVFPTEAESASVTEPHAEDGRRSQ